MKNHVIPLSALVWVFVFGFGLSPALSSEEVQRIGPFGLEKSGPSRTERFDGRELVVRVYKDWRAEPMKFEEVSLRLRGVAAKLELGNVAESAVVVIAADGQRDEEVKKELSGFLYAEPYRKGLEFCMPSQSTQRASLWIFNDGLGEPLPNVTVGLFVSSPEGPKVMVRSSTGNELRIPTPIGSLRSLPLVIWHPDYGFAEMRGAPGSIPGRGNSIEVPLVRKGSQARERGIRGVIVGPDDKPVQGATIACRYVRTLGEGLINCYDERCRAMSDEYGKFSLYMPNDNGGMARGYLIPPQSTYDVRIEAPREMGLLPQNAAIGNEGEVGIVMERGSHFHTFVFMDDNSMIKERERLPSSIKIERAGKPPIILGYEDWKDGGKFPVGTYTAEARGEQFEPIEVTEKSPRELVFGPTATITYYGQVLEGISGRPMEGAFVMGHSATCGEGDFSQITDAEWESLEALGAVPSMEDAALAPLKKMYVFDRIVRTDAGGRYEMSYKERSGLYGLIFFARDYLGVLHYVAEMRADEEGGAAIPVKRLFPAAKAVVKPVIEEGRASILPQWTVNNVSECAWVKDLLACDNDRETRFTYDKWLPQNKVCSFHVPAGVGVSVRLRTPYEEQWCPATLAEDMRLVQGQVRDFGEVKFARALQISVKVLNSKGEPLEGVPVVRWLGRRGLTVAHNTDKEGVTWFDVPPGTKGQFGVSFWGPGPSKRETMDYEVGTDDDGRQFEMTISDEMVQLLFGGK